jgi:hypothetical protein
VIAETHFHHEGHQGHEGSMLIRLGDISPATSKGEKPFTTKDTKEAWIFSNFFLCVLCVLRGESLFSLFPDRTSRANNDGAGIARAVVVLPRSPALIS